MELRTTFRQRSSIGDWQYYEKADDVSPVEICNGEFRSYVDLPGDLREVTIIFTNENPMVPGAFKLTSDYVDVEGIDGPVHLGGLETESSIGWYSSTREFLARKFDEGYRYATVEY